MPKKYSIFATNLENVMYDKRLRKAYTNNSQEILHFSQEILQPT